MLEYARPILADAERAASRKDAPGAMAALRRLCLDDFGLVTLEMPHKDYPRLSEVLPSMASAQVQQNWTGASGQALLRQSLNFTRIVSHQFRMLTGAPLDGKRILDYGCGYGRLLRLFNYFADVDRLAGCDPWDQSIELCREAGIRCRLDMTEYLPERLPYEAASFDLVYAFSVFTHTSLRASRIALNALRAVIAPDGVFALTIRPVEYWDHHAGLSPNERQDLKQSHHSKGIAFRPHNRSPVDGDITYGDTSMTFEFLKSLAPGWTIAGYEHSLDDYHQIIVLLRPA